MPARKESSSCVSPCVWYSIGYTVILWVIEKNEREPFILLPPTLSVLVQEELNASVISATEGTLVVLQHMMLLQCFFPTHHITPVTITLPSRAGLLVPFGKKCYCSLAYPSMAVKSSVC